MGFMGEITMKTPIRATCLFCDETIEQFMGRDIAIPNGKRIEYWHLFGDTGCTSNPITSIARGTGPHFAVTRENIEWIALKQSPGCTINKKGK